MAEAPKGKTTPPRAVPRETVRSDTIEPLQVRYFRRMSLQRVYGVTVGWPKRKDARRAPPGAPPVTLRLLMAGAQVVPTEHTLDPNDPDAKATFYVTPLAKGWLRNERLEILVGGRKVQDMPLPAKVGGQGLTWTLLLLAVLVPWLLLTYGKYSPLALSEADVRDSPLMTQPDAKGGLKSGLKVQINSADDKARTALKVSNQFKIKTAGELLSERIAKEVPDVPGFADDSVGEGLRTFREKLGDLYDNIIQWNKEYPLAFYAFFLFLILAVIAFAVQQDKRRIRSSKPIVIPRAGVDGVGPRRDEVMV